MDIREKYKVEPTEEKKTMSKFQRTMHQLAQPYKESKAYEVYGEGKHHITSPEEKGEPSVFWNSDVQDIDEYEDSDIIR